VAASEISSSVVYFTFSSLNFLEDEFTRSLMVKNRVHCQVLRLKFVILTNQEAKIRRIMVQGQPGQKVRETLSQRIKAECGGEGCNPSTNRRDVVQAGLSIKQDP
jgi:hypothetical protein